MSKIKNSKKSKIGHSLAFFIISKDYEKFRVQDIKQKHLNVKSSINSIPCTQVPQFTSPRQHLKVKRPLSLLPYAAQATCLEHSRFRVKKREERNYNSTADRKGIQYALQLRISLSPQRMKK